ncbi:synaptotagmin-like protein 4 [Ctenocephalides felis]|uniref:synaptotagmin-like protein 4 n=1 Tax=Ctenocephalides felis TaxID=7515 RepID=UPI000E6E2796|nr:synaptotagmin-like protein 4 [Ctenocephalides felis]
MYEIKLPSTSGIKYKPPGRKTRKKRLKEWFRKRCLGCIYCKKKGSRKYDLDSVEDTRKVSFFCRKFWKKTIDQSLPPPVEDFNAKLRALNAQNNDGPSNSSSMVTLPLTPSREATLRRSEDCKWKDSPKIGSTFLGDILGTRDKFLERLEYDRSIPRKKKAKDQTSEVLVADDSGVSANSSPLTRLRTAGGHHRDLGQDWAATGGLQDDDVTGIGSGSDRMLRLHSNRSLSSLGLRSDSMASVYSGAGDGRYGTVAVKGEVEFGLQYNYKTDSLMIRIKQCRDLAQVDAKRNRSDPYVKVYLLPDKSKSGKRKTKVKKHTVNPIFEETLSFNLSLEELKTRTLWLTVWHSDMFGRNDFLGEVMMPLEDKVFDDPAPVWYPLQERTEPFEESVSHKGDVMLALKFVPPGSDTSASGKAGKNKKSRGSLHVLVKEAKNLTGAKANGTSDPFCKSYLLPDKGRSSKQKTPVIRRCLNPAWNYTFVYDDVTLQDLNERALELTVWDHDRLGSNEFLGMVRLSLGTGKYQDKQVEWMDSHDREMALWRSMLDRPNFWVEGCISLRNSNVANSKV